MIRLLPTYVLSYLTHYILSLLILHREESVQIVEETKIFNSEDKSCIPEATLSARSRDKGKKITVNAMSNIEGTNYGKSKPERGLSIDVSKRKKRLEHPGTMRNGKHNFVVSYGSIKLVIFKVQLLSFECSFQKFSLILKVSICCIEYTENYCCSLFICRYPIQKFLWMLIYVNI